MDIITKTSEPRLMKMLMDMRHDPKGTAIHFHFSNLTMHYRTNYHLRLALNTINEHLKNHSGVTYLLENQDIIVVLISSKADIIDKVVFNLKYLFQDDPLTKDNGFGENSLCSVYFLNFEMTKFIKKCDDLMKDYQVRIKKQQVEGHKGNVNLLSDVLKSIENKLFTEDIGKYIRRQPVAAIVDGNAKPQTIYEEVYVSLIHLKKILDERITQCSPRVINQFLVEKLDEIVLRHIMLNHENFFAKPVSLNLNIPAIMDEKFQEFLKTIPEEKRASIIIEFQVSDIFYDIAGYKAAKDFLHSQNVRVCIDGVNNLSLLQIDRQSLDADLIKLQWNSDIAKNLNKAENQALVAKIKSSEPTRIILSRCDDEKAVQYGHVLGIKMFQGWHIDRTLGVKVSS